MIRLVLPIALALAAPAFATTSLDARLDAIATARVSPGRDAVLVKRLAALGPNAQPHLLAPLAGPSHAVRALPTVARERFTAALVEVVGTRPSIETTRVLTALLADVTTDSRYARSLFSALGKGCRVSSSLDPIVAHAGPEDPLAHAALAGLSHCRTHTAAKVLLQRLESTPATTLVVVDALGLLGSSWAWTALGPSATDEGLMIRTLARDALLARYLAAPDGLRTAIARSIVMLDAPGTAPKLLAPGFEALRSKWERMHPARAK